MWAEAVYGRIIRVRPHDWGFGGQMRAVKRGIWKVVKSPMLRTCNAFVRYNSPKDLNLLQADSDTPPLCCVWVLCALCGLWERKNGWSCRRVGLGCRQPREYDQYGSRQWYIRYNSAGCSGSRTIILGKEERIKEEHIFSPFMGSGGVLLLGSFCGCAWSEDLHLLKKKKKKAGYVLGSGPGRVSIVTFLFYF